MKRRKSKGSQVVYPLVMRNWELRKLPSTGLVHERPCIACVVSSRLLLDRIP